jgi:hypothetical protein
MMPADLKRLHKYMLEIEHISGCDGGFREELAPRMKKKKERRVYLPRVLGSGQVMMPADLKRLHKYMLEIEHISNWQAPFIVAAGLLVVGAAVWAFWVDPEASVVEEKYKLPTAASVAAG